MYKWARLDLNQKERRDYTHVCDQKYMTDSRLTNAHAWLGSKQQEVLLSIQIAYVCMTKNKKDSRFTNAYAWPFLGKKREGEFRRRAQRLSPKAA